METMDQDHSRPGFLEKWYYRTPDMTSDGPLCVIRSDVTRLMSAHVQLPEHLVGAWEDYEQAGVALALAACRRPIRLIDGPPLNPRWLGIDAADALARMLRLGKTPDEDELHQWLFVDAETVAERVEAASWWAAQGRSVEPVEPTYPHGRIKELMVRTDAAAMRGQVMLRPGESSWNPAANYRPFVNETDDTKIVTYEITINGITAEEELD